ncbi:HE71A factor, partial [Formicarius rufipectus]|nr:HE71A factor [Formicarius rufipectus]
SSSQWVPQLLKPLLEKLRRERLNRSLERLRLLLLEGTGDQRLRNPKVEKAEILQKTLQFLRAQPHPESLAPEELEQLLARRYRSGYRACLARAARFLRDIPGATRPATPP